MNHSKRLPLKGNRLPRFFVKKFYDNFYSYWLAEEEDLVAIRAKDPQTAPLMLTAFQGRLVFFLSFVFLPLFVAVAGVMIYVQRRNVTR